MYTNRTRDKKVALICVLTLLACMLPLPAHRAAAQEGCTLIYGPRDGWMLELKASDPSEYDQLMDRATYLDMLKGLEE